MVPVGAGVGMYSGAVPGDSKVLFWYEAALHGRQDGHMVEELPQVLLKVERDILPGHEPVHEVKVGTRRREGILGTADERSEDTVILKPVHPKGKGRLG